MSTKAKQRIITVLQIFVGLGVIVILVMLVLLAGKIKANQQENHNDTADATNTIICMLQVPVAQRTPDLAMQCRKEVQQANDAANNTSSTSSSATTIVTPATPTTPSSSTVTTTTATPNTPVTTPTPATPVSDQSGLDSVPLVGGLFKSLGL